MSSIFPILEQSRLGSAWAYRLTMGCLSLLLGFPIPVSAEIELEYQRRGNYNEGVRGKTVGGEDLVLISAMVDYQEPVKKLPDKLQVQFYLEKPDAVDIRVREIEQKYFYWLDTVNPTKPWIKGAHNHFAWDTASVLQVLNSRMNMYALGIVIKLTPNRRADIDYQVAPPVFFSQTLPSRIAAYRFDLKPGENALLNISIDQGTGTDPVYSTRIRRAVGGRPVPIIWNVDQADPGFYRLVVDGYFLSSNALILRRIGFVHQPTLKP